MWYCQRKRFLNEHQSLRLGKKWLANIDESVLSLRFVSRKSDIGILFPLGTRRCCDVESTSMSWRWLNVAPQTHPVIGHGEGGAGVNWRWLNVATTSCAQWGMQVIFRDSELGWYLWQIRKLRKWLGYGENIIWSEWLYWILYNLTTALIKY